MKKILFVPALMMFLVSCDSDSGSESNGDNFDREAMLTHWADNIIIPAYENVSAELAEMKSATSTFTDAPNTANLTTLRSAWLDAYIAWQHVEMFEIGRAEEITLRNFINVYPLNAPDMESTLLSGDYDLTSVNRQDEQGFSAVDYLLHGVADTDANIVAVYTDQTDGEKYKTYLTDVVGRMETLVNDVLGDWKNGYRETFISRSGSSATESVNKMVNDYIFYYEKHLRAGKVGIPAGVFSSEKLSGHVEARFRGDVSKQLLMQAIDAAQYFFNGKHFGSNEEGLSLNDYLDELNTLKDGEDLEFLINSQFAAARNQAQNLNDDLGVQVETDNTVMTKTYDELQKNVVLMKVDMLQALNIRVDYVDADGD